VAHKRSADQKGSIRSAQRKTTLKWDSNGELTWLDMARIIDQFKDRSLKECEL
jgi:hypothetical protein